MAIQTVPAPFRRLRPVAIALPCAFFLFACEGIVGDGFTDTTGGAAGAGGDVVGGSGGAGGDVVGGGGGGGTGGDGGAPWQSVQTDWCTAEWLGIDDHTCFYAPTSLPPNPAVLYFLHGMMPPDSSPKGMQAIAKAAADKHGFVAVFPRGKQGLCAWDSSVLDWWCWPTSRQAVDTHAAAFVDEWTGAEVILEGALGTTFERRYVMGFSNGGYFAAYIGLEALLAVDGIGVVAAGRSYVDESLMPKDADPFYVAVGELDVDSVKNSASNLAFVLGQHAWPVDFVLHSNRGHEIRADDFDGAAAI